MRNLKRALSLALASVMLMGMMVVGSSAASFPDVDDNDNIEAIDVLETVEVMIGNEKGDFEPDKNVTRAEMAVVMAKLLNYDYKYYETTCPFNDVPDWAKGWVGACAANGIVSGRGDGVYDPNATVTAVEAASMMMRALGYFQNSGDYKGGFEAATVAQASKINLFADIDGNARDPMNRNQVAQLALNTLEARMVDFTGDMGFELNGVTVGYKSEYTYRTGSQERYNRIVEDGNDTTVTGTGAAQYYVQLGEQLYNGDLRKTKDGNSDDFERPATVWGWKTQEIGTYADTPDYSFTTAISGSTNADKVKAMGLKGFTWDGVYYENGHRAIVSGDDSAARLEKLAGDVCADGVLVEVFMDDGRVTTIDKVVVVRTQMMQVNTVNSKEVTLKKLSNDREGGKFHMDGVSGGFYDVKAVKEGDACYDMLKDLKKDDYVLIVPVRDGAGNKVAEAVTPETASGRLTNIYTKSNDTKVKSITVDGETYKMSYSWTSDGDKLTNTTQLNDRKDTTVYLDTYGNAIYVKDVVAGNDVIIVKNVTQGLVDGKIVAYLNGWDVNGETLSLNLGNIDTDNICSMSKNKSSIRGTVWEYAADTRNDGDYVLVARGDDTTAGLVYAPNEQGSNDTKQWIKNDATQAAVFTTSAKTWATAEKLPYASDVKFIFLTSDGGAGNKVDNITIRTGVMSVGEDKATTNTYENTDTVYGISYILNSDKDKVIAVVIDEDDDAAVTENLIFVKTVNEHWWDKDAGSEKTAFEAYDAEGNRLDNGDSKLNQNDDTIGGTSADAGWGRFHTYTENSNGTYSLSRYTKTDKATSVATGLVISSADEGIAYGGPVVGTTNGDQFVGQGRSGANDVMNTTGATFVDLEDDGIEIGSLGDMRDAIALGKATSFRIAYIYNGGDNNNVNRVSTVYVVKAEKPAAPQNYTLAGVAGVQWKVGNGSFGSDGVSATAANGTTITLKLADTTMKPTVKTSGADITPTATGTAGEYTFTMPTRNVTSVKLDTANAYTERTEIKLDATTSLVLYDKTKSAPTTPQALQLIVDEIVAGGKQVGEITNDGTDFSIPSGFTVNGSFVADATYKFKMNGNSIKAAETITVDEQPRLLQGTDKLSALIGYNKANDGTYFKKVTGTDAQVADFIVATGGSSNTGTDLAGLSFESGYFKVTADASLGTGVNPNGTKLTATVDVAGVKAFVKKTDNLVVTVSPDSTAVTTAATALGTLKATNCNTATVGTPALGNATTASSANAADMKVVFTGTAQAAVTGSITVTVSGFADDCTISLANS